MRSYIHQANPIRTTGSKSYQQPSESEAACFIGHRVLTVHATFTLACCLYSHPLLSITAQRLHSAVATTDKQRGNSKRCKTMQK